MKRALLVLAAVWLVFPTGASAHSDAVGSKPANGAKLDRLPSVVTFTFDERPTVAAAALRSPDGTVRKLKATVDGHRIRVKGFPGGTFRGRYKVSYRVVSEDGHPSSGSIVFTVVRGKKVAFGEVPESDAPNPADPFGVGWPIVGGVVIAALVFVTVFARKVRKRRS